MVESNPKLDIDTAEKSFFFLNLLKTNVILIFPTLHGKI